MMIDLASYLGKNYVYCLGRGINSIETIAVQTDPFTVLANIDVLQW